MKLRERQDPAGLIIIKRVQDIILNVRKLREERKRIYNEKEKRVGELKREYARKIRDIEQDIISLENAGKMIAGVTEYIYFRSQLNKDKEAEPEMKTSDSEAMIDEEIHEDD